MEKYLGDTLKYNKPYDQMAKELITATRRRAAGGRRLQWGGEFPGR